MFGAHLSNNCLYTIPTTTKTYGMSTFQIFLRNNRNMSRRQYPDYEIQWFNERLLSEGIYKFVIHASYAMNPCDNLERYRKIVRDDFSLMSRMAGEQFYVLHPGSSKTQSLYAAFNNLEHFVREVTTYSPNVKIALEYMAGAGTQVISSIAQLNYVAEMFKDLSNVCFCIDTCHVYASGEDLDEVFKTVSGRVGVIHLNSSQAAKGTHVDRHANLGTGVDDLIETLKSVKRYHLKYPDVPIILETPSDGVDKDLEICKQIFVV